MAFLQQLVALGERQLAAEKRAAVLIKKMLNQYGIPYKRHVFTTSIPKMLSAKLLADGKPVECAVASFVSGEITDKESVISSAMPGAWFQGHPNISVNPYCTAVSRGNHYFSPGIAVSHAALQKVFRAKTIRGTVKVKKMTHTSENILVGNTRNPHTVVFAHYDSIGPGAIDNASGVAASMAAVINNPELLTDHLIVFAGNEELSYDNPIYWGRGFRCLQKDMPHLFIKSKRLLVIDCVGNGKAVVTNDSAIVPRAFPIKNAQKYAKKTSLIMGDFSHLMTVYHSQLDDGRGMTAQSLKQATDLLMKELS